MRSEFSTEKDARTLTALFMLSTALIIGGTAENPSRSWLSLVLSLAAAVPLIFLWTRILGTFPEKDLFGIFDEAFGKREGKLFAGLTGAYAFLTAVWTLGTYSSFVTILSSREFDKTLPALLVAAAGAVIAGAGFRAVSGTGRIFFAVRMAFLVLTLTMSLLSIDFSAFPLPLFGKDPASVFSGALSVSMMPFGEVLVILGALPPPAKGEKRSRGIAAGALIVFFALLAVFLRNVLMLGERSMDNLYFHSPYALRIFGIGSFFQRMEILISATDMIVDTLRFTVCIFCVGRSAAKCLRLDEHAVITVPAAAAVFALSEMMLANGQAVSVFREMNKYISLPFCVGIPLVCGIALFFQGRKRKEGNLPLKS